MDVSYESLLMYKTMYVNLVLNFFDLPILENVDALKIKDGNTKHYKRLPWTLKNKKFAKTGKFNTLRNFDKMHL